MPSLRWQWRRVGALLLGAFFSASAVASTCDLSVSSAADVTTLMASLSEGACNEISVTWKKTITLSTPFQVNSVSLKVTGSGSSAEIKGGDSSQLFFIANGASLTLEKLILSGGTTNGIGFGGAVFASNATLALDLCEFRYNSAGTNSGGAVYALSSDVTITDTTFADNSAVDGGAVYLAYCTSLVRNCFFSHNNASLGSGGALKIYSGSADVRASLFDGNSAWYGGALDLQDATVAVEAESSFTNNTAHVNGSSIRIDKYFPGTVTISDTCTFDGFSLPDLGSSATASAIAGAYTTTITDSPTPAPTSAPPPTPAPVAPSKNNDLSSGAIAGIVIGSVAGAALLLGLIGFGVVSSRRKGSSATTTAPPKPAATAEAQEDGEFKGHDG